MSSTTVINSLAAAITEGLPTPKAGRQATDKPVLSFAEIPILAGVWQAAQTDNVAALGGAGVDLASVDATVSVTGALAGPTPTDQPAGSQDGQTQGVEMLMLAAGWGMPVSPVAEQPLDPQIAGQALSPNSQDGSVVDAVAMTAAGSVPQPEPSVPLELPQLQVAAVGSASPVVAEQAPGPLGTVVTQPATDVVGFENAPAPAPTVTTTTGAIAATDTVIPEAVGGTYTAQTPDGSPAVTPEYAADSRQTGPAPAIPVNVESSARGTAAVQETQSPGVEQAAQLDHDRGTREKSESFARTLNDASPTAQETQPQAGQDVAVEESDAYAGVVAKPGLRVSARETSESRSGVGAIVPSESAASEMGRSSDVSSHVSDQTPAVSGEDGLAVRNPAPTLDEQIRDSVTASLTRGERQVTIRLHPPELGSVTMRFQEQGGQVNGVLEVSHVDTRQRVEQALPQVIQSLQEAGVQVRRIEVVVSDQPGNDASKQQFQQEAWAQQQGQERYPHQSPRSIGSNWASGDGGTQNRVGVPDGDTTMAGMPTGRIDMLA